MTVINGSIFALRKSQVSLTDDQDNLVKKVTLSKGDDLLDGVKKSSTKNKAQNEDYDVMGIEDEGN